MRRKTTIEDRKECCKKKIKENLHHTRPKSIVNDK
jgi:hypothetical protein